MMKPQTTTTWYCLREDQQRVFKLNKAYTEGSLGIAIAMRESQDLAARLG